MQSNIMSSNVTQTSIESDFLRYLFENECKPGDRLPSLAELSETTGVSVGKLQQAA